MKRVRIIGGHKDYVGLLATVVEEYKTVSYILIDLKGISLKCYDNKNLEQIIE